MSDFDFKLKRMAREANMIEVSLIAHEYVLVCEKLMGPG